MVHEYRDPNDRKSEPYLVASKNLEGVLENEDWWRPKTYGLYKLVSKNTAVKQPKLIKAGRIRK
jgi:hypothetical protein